MRAFAYSVLAAALIVSACKRSGEEKAEAKFEKAQEHVKEESRAFQQAKKDLGAEQQDAIEKARRVMRAEQELANARIQYKAEMTEQLARIDARIAELQGKGDEKSRKTAERLQKHREGFAAKLQKLESEPPSTWEHLDGTTNEPLRQRERMRQLNQGSAEEPNQGSAEEPNQGSAEEPNKGSADKP